MALDQAALTDIRNYVKRRCGYIQYRIGTTMYKVPITDVQVKENGIVRVQASVAPGPCTINRMELYNTQGQRWAHQDVNITLNNVQTGILYWFDFTIKEGETKDV